MSSAEAIYDRGDSFPRKPYPCYDGIKKAMEVYDSNEMRRYTPETFYDDSLMRELTRAASGQLTSEIVKPIGAHAHMHDRSRFGLARSCRDSGRVRVADQPVAPNEGAATAVAFPTA